MITALREWRVGTGNRDDMTTERRRSWLDPRVVAPICAAGVYVAIVAVRLPALLSSYFSYTDFPEALRLGDAVFHGGYGQGLAVSSQTGIGPLWVVGLVNQVTGGHAAATAFGPVVLLITAGLMTWTAQRVFGFGPSVAVGALCVAVPPVVAWEFLTPIAHETTLLMTAVFAWQLVALSRGTRGGGLAASIAVGVCAGVCVISDPLVLAAAVAPWAICAVMLALRHPARRLALLLTVCAAVAGAALVDVWAAANHIVEHGNTEIALGLQGIADGLRTTATTLGQMLTGAWYGDALSGVFVVGALGLFVAVIYMASRALSVPSVDAASGRRIYVWFWLLSAAAIVCAFCMSGLGTQLSPVNYQGHYVDGLWFAVAALVPVGMVMAPRYSGVVVAGVTCLALISAAGIVRAPAYPFQGPDYADSAQLTSTLEQLAITNGYGGYWESYAIGWHSDGRTNALPLQQCSTAESATGLCRYEFAAPAWYQARSGPVFVIVSRAPCRGDDLCISAAKIAGLEAPEVVRTVGLLQVDVYAHDVFAALPIATTP